MFQSCVRKCHGVLWGCVGDFFFTREQMLQFLKRDLSRDRNTQTCHYEGISSVNSNLMLQEIRNNITDVLLPAKKMSFTKRKILYPLYSWSWLTKFDSGF